MNYNNYQTEVCQICLALEPEDVCIIHEMLTQIFKNYLEENNKINALTLSQVFRHIKFRKTLALIFDSKYLEILDNCQHQKLLQVFVKMWEQHIGPQEKIMVFIFLEFWDQFFQDQKILENGLDILFKTVTQKQDKLKNHREQFDRLAQQIFNCDDETNQDENLDSNDSQGDNFDLDQDDDSQGQQKNGMQFNKNSNKNKFQKRSIDILKKWFLDHLENPYPDQTEKQRLSQQTGMHVKQIQNWFTNSRKRYLEPLRKKFEQSHSHGEKVPVGNSQQQSSEGMVKIDEVEVKYQKEENDDKVKKKLKQEEDQLKQILQIQQNIQNQQVATAALQNPGLQIQQPFMLPSQIQQYMMMNPQYGQAVLPQMNILPSQLQQYLQMMEWQRQMQLVQVMAFQQQQQQLPIFQMMPQQFQNSQYQNMNLNNLNFMSQNQNNMP